MEATAPCVHCRTNVTVPTSYTDGDHIKCGACNTQHRVVRGNGSLRLVIADIAPLREALRVHNQRIESLENQLQAARGSFGIGANGFGVGVIYVLLKVAWEEQPLTREIIVNAVVIALLTGFVLELANFLFLSKRRLMNQLSEELETMRHEAKDLQKKIRDASSTRR
jgi:hypothetical protein